MKMFIARNMLSSHLVKQIQYIVMVTIMKTKMATKICNMTVILTVRIFVMFSGMPTSGQNEIVWPKWLRWWDGGLWPGCRPSFVENTCQLPTFLNWENIMNTQHGLVIQHLGITWDNLEATWHHFKNEWTTLGHNWDLNEQHFSTTWRQHGEDLGKTMGQPLLCSMSHNFT